MQAWFRVSMKMLKPGTVHLPPERGTYVIGVSPFDLPNDNHLFAKIRRQNAVVIL